MTGGTGVPASDAVLDRTRSLSPGPPGTNLRTVLSRLGISFSRQLRHCLAYSERRMPLRTSPGRPGPTVSTAPEFWFWPTLREAASLGG